MVVVKLLAFSKKKPWAFRFLVRQWFKILCPLLKTLHQGSPDRRFEKDTAEKYKYKTKKTVIPGNPLMFFYFVHLVSVTYLNKRAVCVKHF
ncbi:hypothetical protein DO021_10280 [Desulfobacter hydrogenophilus]|uniref:Uncharacterized protein n=1 Tax=Desulfobacter hydrogenophilus TaxID=2291 RepID=A0A328FDE4_9BACT|nr:hypothetical protein DO021_10280 [Desulfobacter hydrogenophilus]